MSIVSLPSALALISLVLLVRGSAPGDEHDYCVNTVNVDNPPSAREAGRNILLDTYNYAALLTGVNSFSNPVLNTFPPVFQRFDVDGSSPKLEWGQFRPVGHCRLQVADCKFGNVQNPPLQDNWLVTQFIRLDSPHTELRVFLNHSITLCTEGSSVVCRDSYSVYVLPANEGMNITLETVASTTVDAVATFAEADTELHTRYASFSQRVDEYDGFFVALRSQDTCVQVHRLQVFYWTCPGGVQGLVEVDESAEPLDSRSFRCVGNSTQLIEGNRLTCVVDRSGEDEYTEWRLLGDSIKMSITEVCQCDPGFQLLMGNEVAVCSECPEGMFKEGYSNDACASCPEYSFTNVTGSASCQCVEGRYRGTTESASLPCASPPSAPNNLTLVDVSRRTVSLSWDPPHFLGSRGTFFYTIWYRREGDTEWTRGDNVTNGNGRVVNYTQFGLVPHSQHIVRVTADSMATDTVPEELAHLRSLNITVMTLPDVPGRGSVPLLTSPLYTDFITVTLVAPEYPNGVITQYNIRWYREGQVDSAQVVTVSGTEQSYTISGLTPGTYMVQVQAVSAQGVGNYSDPASIIVESFPLAYVGAIVAGAVIICCGLIAIIFLAILIGYCCRLRRRYRSGRKLSKEEAERAELVSFTSNGTNPTGKRKNYVDPRNYASTNDALVDFAKEIPQYEVNLQNVIGSGEFGDVLVGNWYKPKSSKPIRVAVKTLKDGSPKKARDDFLTEATIMGQFDDNNVIHLHGVVSKSRPVMIVMEFMDNGSLESYLKKNDGRFDTHRLVRMATGVASGMKYLAGMGFVHRDLAARNVLVDAKETCKISDFGLSRETEENVYNVKTGGKIPVRWTPPEAIHFRKFSEKSDVWSFGVLLWEVMSFGAQPYADWGNQQVLREVDKGYRLPCPETSPDSVYQVMMNCWEKESVRRPTFAQCKDDLEDLMRNSFVGRTRPPRVKKEVKSPLAYSTVREWLEELKMEQYTQNFMDLGLTLKECCSLTEEDVETLGVTVAGHRHKIFASIQCADGGELTTLQ